MRRFLSDIWTSFWLAFEAARMPTAKSGSNYSGIMPRPRPGPGVELAIEPLRLVAPSPRSWPDEHEWCNVEVDCEFCGESVVQVTSAWLLEHAGPGGLVCPFCNVPTDQAVTYDASA